MPPRPLPDVARLLCEALAAPPRLVAHLTLVHDAAFHLVGAVRDHFPGLDVDRNAVLFGAATHDLGKVLHPGELSGPGGRHEEDGPPLLERHGVPADLARFAASHGARGRADRLDVEDLLVALADSTWRGRRNEEVEARLAERLAERTGADPWAAFLALDTVVERACVGAEERLAWQAAFPV